MITTRTVLDHVNYYLDDLCYYYPVNVNVNQTLHSLHYVEIQHRDYLNPPHADCCGMRQAMATGMNEESENEQGVELNNSMESLKKETRVFVIEHLNVVAMNDVMASVAMFYYIRTNEWEGTYYLH